MANRTQAGAKQRSATSSSRIHTILFLAANRQGPDRLALDEEARAIELELERSGRRDQFELVTRWAVQPLDLLRELRRLKPTIVHFSGHGAGGATARNAGPNRDVAGAPGAPGAPEHGLFFHGADGRLQLVSTVALEQTFGAAGASVKLVVLNACYSEVQARALVAHVDCVIGVSGAIRDESARSFAIGFYGGLGEGEPVTAAFRQGCAAMCLGGLPDRARPQLRVRAGIGAAEITLADRFSDGLGRITPAAETGPVYANPQVDRPGPGSQDAAARVRPARPPGSSPTGRAFLFVLVVLMLGIGGGTTWYGVALAVSGALGSTIP